jgi:trimethylamine---corrinoid protein Co-methyltransferase
MNSEKLEQIHHTSLRILAELGIQITHPAMVDRMAGLGCKVYEQRVYIPPDLVTMALEDVPSSFHLYGREHIPGVEVKVGGPFRGTNTGILPYLIDFESGLVRQSVLADVETTTRVLDALSEVDIVYVSLLDATKELPHMVTVIDFAATIRNTTKPLVGPGLTNRSEARAVLQMAAALNGGNGSTLAQRPTCAPFVGAITPLRFPNDVIDALEEIVEAGVPFMALTNPIMGATAPYSISGTVALGHAEVLAMVVMAYSLRPGLPVLSFNTPSIADMRTLASTTGGPEAGLMRSLAVELAQHKGLTAWGHGHTSSPRLDIQAADEKSINALLIAQNRPSLLGGLGGLANVTLTSYETLVMDNERFAAFRRIEQGVDVDDEHLAYTVVADMVQGVDLFTHPHTLRHLRGREIWKPKLGRRQGLVNGQPERETTLDRARAEARRIMDNHIVEPLPPLVQAAIDEILHQYDCEYLR